MRTAGVRVHRALRALLAVVLGAAAIGILLSSPPASAAPGDAALTDSAVTKSGTGAFAGLDVTVSQTKNLISQVVTVSWTGGVPTLPLSGQFGVNYLQIMQCWGDEPLVPGDGEPASGGPDRTQCQYGGSSLGSTTGGAFVKSRQVDTSLVDSNETLKHPAGSIDLAFVPFWPAGGDQPTGPARSNFNDFFDSQVTNEVPFARTRGDRTGLEFFEVQTVRQAAGLGCGEPVTTGGATVGRSCWLVIVPRGNTEVDGSPRTEGNWLSTSPMSQSNWDNRIVFPLEFLPVDQACPLGAPERRVVGHELALGAVSRWQPALCAGGGALYSYTQLTDDLTRSLVQEGGSPGLALMTDPIPPDRAPPDRPLVYAPIALSGLAIAFNVEHQPDSSLPPDEQALDGLRFTSMKLTPRLVAKLLTQSYQGAVVGVQDYLKNNAAGLTVDPEFLDLNPEYRGFANINQPPDALVQLGGADVTSLLWRWVQADPDASAFLAGTPDENGMVVNPHNKGLTLPTSTFPRDDQSCIDTTLIGDIPARLCTLDSHPFTNNMHDAGRAASRGDTLAEQNVPGGAGNKTPILVKADRQNPGKRALLAVVDTALATRYGLPTAALRNAAGEFVAPTNASLRAGAAAMKPSAVPGVLASDPGATDDPGVTDPAVYPLAALSYAVTSPSTLDAAAGKDYAAFLRYAAGAGQQPGVAPGQLPLGMAPLPDALRAQTAAAAATIEAQAGKTAPGAPVQQRSAGVVSGVAAGSAAGSTGGPSAAAGPGATATSSPGGAGAPPADVAAQAAAKAPGATQQPVASLRRTPPTAIAAMGGLLLALLISGPLAAALALIAHRLSAPKRAAPGKGVVPTEP